MKIAKFKRFGDYTFETVAEDWADRNPSYMRVSEYIEVEFPPLHDDEVVRKQLDALDGAEKELRNRFEIAIGQIEQQRQELRAITYRPE